MQNPQTVTVRLQLLRYRPCEQRQGKLTVGTFERVKSGNLKVKTPRMHPERMSVPEGNPAVGEFLRPDARLASAHDAVKGSGTAPFAEDMIAETVEIQFHAFVLRKHGSKPCIELPLFLRQCPERFIKETARLLLFFGKSAHGFGVGADLLRRQAVETVPEASRMESEKHPVPATERTEHTIRRVDPAVRGRRPGDLKAPCGGVAGKSRYR